MSVIELRKVYNGGVLETVRLNELLRQLSGEDRRLTNIDIWNILEQRSFYAAAQFEKNLGDDEDPGRVGLPVAMASAHYPLVAPISQRIVYVDDVVVHEGYRGRGYGQLLTEALIVWARDRQAAFVDLTSAPNRVAANELYLKMGIRIRPDIATYSRHNSRGHCPCKQNLNL